MPLKVIISPGYGSGWSTWADMSVRYVLATSPRLVALVEAGASPNKIEEAARALVGSSYAYFGGNLESLEVREVPDGAAWAVIEYDGAERLIHSGPGGGMWGVNECAEETDGG